MEKLDQTWFACHDTWHVIQFSSYYSFEMVKEEKMGICKKIRVKLPFYGIFKPLTWKKVGQTWIVDMKLCKQKWLVPISLQMFFLALINYRKLIKCQLKIAHCAINMPKDSPSMFT